MTLLLLFALVLVVLACIGLGVWLTGEELASDVAVDLTPNARPNTKDLTHARWN
jgi:hypothetical protein